MQSVALGDPDEALVETVLVKLFIDRQLDGGEEVVRFLMARMPRSVTAARHVAAAIDRVALTARRRQVALQLARARMHEVQVNAAENSTEGVKERVWEFADHRRRDGQKRVRGNGVGCRSE